VKSTQKNEVELVCSRKG